MKKKWSEVLQRCFTLLLVGALFLQLSVLAIDGTVDTAGESSTEQSDSSQSDETAASSDETEEAGTAGEETDSEQAQTDEEETNSDEDAASALENENENADAQETDDEALTETSNETDEGTDSSVQSAEESTEETAEEIAEEATVETTEATEAAQANSETGIQIGNLSSELASDAIIVSSYAELSAALSGDNGYVYIYLAGDITQSSTDTGIAIHASKASVIIDGLAPDATDLATFTQRASSTLAYTIRVLAANSVTKSVTLRNMNLVGQNYYGIVAAEDAVSGLALYYENINFTGPQVSYNRSGTVHYSDSSISIVSAVAAGGSAAQEVAEATAVTLSGTVTIQSASTGYSVFWMVGSSTSITLEAGASVSVTAGYYFLYADGSYPVVNLYEGASLTYTGASYGLLYDAQRLQSLHLYANAELSVTQSTSSYAYGTVRIHSALTLDEGSSLTVVRAAGGPAIQMVNSAASIVFTQPERVKLYAPASRLIAFVSTGTLSITADAVNIWTTATGFGNDDISNTPSYHWNKASGQLLTISSSFSGTTQTLSSNLESTDPTDNLTASSFALGSAQMLVLGRYELTIDAVYENSTEVSGTSEYNAALQLHNLSQSSALLAQGSANGLAFSLSLSGSIADGDVLTALSYHNYLRKIEQVTVSAAQENGVLQLKYVPGVLDFGAVQIPSLASIIERASNDTWYVEIEDSRTQSSGWSLIVSLSAPLTAADGSTLAGALVYVDESGNRTALSENGLLIRSGSGSETASWSESQGILLWADPSAIVGNQSYSGTISWTLQDAP